MDRLKKLKKLSKGIAWFIVQDTFVDEDDLQSKLNEVLKILDECEKIVRSNDSE